MTMFPLLQVAVIAAVTAGLRFLPFLLFLMELLRILQQLILQCPHAFHVGLIPAAQNIRHLFGEDKWQMVEDGFIVQEFSGG